MLGGMALKEHQKHQKHQKRHHHLYRPLAERAFLAFLVFRRRGLRGYPQAKELSPPRGARNVLNHLNFCVALG